MLPCGRTDGRTDEQTSEYRATQSMDSVRLSFAKIKNGAFLFQFCRGSPSNHLPCKHWQGEKLPISYFHQCNVRLEIVDLYLLNPQVLYWGTAKWSPVEIFETFSMARYLKYWNLESIQLHIIGPSTVSRPWLNMQNTIHSTERRFFSSSSRLRRKNRPESLSLVIISLNSDTFTLWQWEFYMEERIPT